MRADSQRGFTLPELLVTGAVFGILAIVAFVVMHPTDYSASQRNALRWQSTALIAQGLNRYVAANGELPSGITSEAKVIGTEENMLDLCFALVPDHMPVMPFDPSDSLATTEDCTEEDARYVTGYSIQRTDANTVVIAAPAAEYEEEISITRRY